MKERQKRQFSEVEFNSIAMIQKFRNSLIQFYFIHLTREITHVQLRMYLI